MKRRQMILPLLALALILTTAIPPALAYFTATTSAKGGYTVHLETTTSIDEGFKDWTKSVSVANTKGEPVFIRARAYAGSAFSLTYSGSGWENRGDGWYYYTSPIAAGGATSPLNVTIGNIPRATEASGFNVAVVYESTPVLYNASGGTYADWTMTLDTGTEQGG